ncbi:putative peptidoglycan glycosyltransferase FtsW [Candidatus Hepatincola sp. Pdp]
MILLLRNYNNVFSKFWWQTDKQILLPIFLLFCISIILVITASPYVAIRIGVEPLYFIKHHILYSLLSMLIIFCIFHLNEKQLIRLSLIGFSISLLLMFWVIFMGTDVKGAKRWVYILGFSIQPSEFAKVFFIGFMAYMWDYTNKLNLKVLYKYFIWVLIYTLFAGLLLLQPDVGMTILITATFFVLLILTGISWFWGVLFSFLGSLLMVAAYFIFPHVNYRVNNFFLDKHTYQVEKALEAISSGKILGKGAGQGSLKAALPDAHTDFIFTVGLEEFGLVFGLFLIYLYIYLIIRIIKHIKQKNSMIAILSLAGYVSLLATQTLIHIFSNVNLMPTKGMTLPVISYGGSSLFATAILMGMILNLTKKDAHSIRIKN